MISPESFNTICLVWIALGVVMFPVLLRVTQPYGRHSKGNWGPMMNNRLGWLFMELPALGVFGYFIGISDNPFTPTVLIPELLWGLHYVHRVFIFPLQIRTIKKKIPCLIVVSGILFNTMNGFLNGFGLAQFSGEYSPDFFTKFHLIAGVILFLAGFVINKYHDRLLIHLRSKSGNGYKIPFGGLFNYVSCPNFLGEIISWAGFALVAFNLPSLSFLTWTLANLTARALDHHRWYLGEFPEYPKDRKAIFPFLL